MIINQINSLTSKNTITLTACLVWKNMKGKKKGGKKIGWKWCFLPFGLQRKVERKRKRKSKYGTHLRLFFSKLRGKLLSKAKNPQITNTPSLHNLNSRKKLITNVCTPLSCILQYEILRTRTSKANMKLILNQLWRSISSFYYFYRPYLN